MVLIDQSSHLRAYDVILRPGKFLRNSADKSINSIFITPDLTKQQRDDAYKLRQEKKQRELEGEENLRIVRGKIIIGLKPSQLDQLLAGQRVTNGMNRRRTSRKTKTLKCTISTPALVMTGLVLGTLVGALIK